MSDVVTVVGGVNHDEILRVSADPVDDGTAEVERTVAAAGGHAANVAVALARLGVPVRLAAAVGGDDHGRRLVRALADEGVDVTEVQVVAAARTGRALVVNAPTVHHMMLERGANDALDPHRVAAAVRRGGGPVVVLDPPRPVLAAVVAAAGTRPLVANPAARVRELVPALPDRDGVTVVCNETEHALADAVASTSWCARWTVVVTRGDRGCSLRAASGWQDLPAVRVALVDPTGAGDAFTAGYAGAAWRGAGPRDACVEGTRLAARAVTVDGAWPPRPALVPA